ncbi:hypothetical protein [Alkalimarinus sediminis]|uniref:Lipoprotein n=1 Tax=Alkalimarinus sediminis TaxID=1632866 RepID=A0A9E8HH23_9ALTE|nr:hypothetical protein [Alkalimarinus sediminis]UZW74533.1 hypothetical protein NNL22_16140 [Alkalimarinus sediminis]
MKIQANLRHFFLIGMVTFSTSCLASSGVYFPQEILYILIAHLVLPVLLAILLVFLRQKKESDKNSSFSKELKNVGWSLLLSWFLSVFLVMFGLLAVVPLVLFAPSFFVLKTLYNELRTKC